MRSNVSYRCRGIIDKCRPRRGEWHHAVDYTSELNGKQVFFSADDMPTDHSLVAVTRSIIRASSSSSTQNTRNDCSTPKSYTRIFVSIFQKFKTPQESVWILLVVPELYLWSDNVWFRLLWMRYCFPSDARILKRNQMSRRDMQLYEDNICGG